MARASQLAEALTTMASAKALTDAPSYPSRQNSGSARPRTSSGSNSRGRRALVERPRVCPNSQAVQRRAGGRLEARHRSRARQGREDLRTADSHRSRVSCGQPAGGCAHRGRVGPAAHRHDLHREFVAELGRMGLVYLHLVDHSSMGAPPVPALANPGLVRPASRAAGRRAKRRSGACDCVPPRRSRSALAPSARALKGEALWIDLERHVAAGGAAERRACGPR